MTEQRDREWVISLAEEIPDMTKPWRGRHLLAVAAPDEETARARMQEEVHRRTNILLREEDILEIHGGRWI